MAMAPGLTKADSMRRMTVLPLRSQKCTDNQMCMPCWTQEVTIGRFAEMWISRTQEEHPSSSLRKSLLAHARLDRVIWSVSVRWWDAEYALTDNADGTWIEQS